MKDKFEICVWTGAILEVLAFLTIGISDIFAGVLFLTGIVPITIAILLGLDNK